MYLQLRELGEGKSEKILSRMRMRAMDRAASAQLMPAIETSPKNPHLLLHLDYIPSRGEAAPHLPEESSEIQEAGKGEQWPLPQERGAGWCLMRQKEIWASKCAGPGHVPGLQNLHMSTFWALLSLPQHRCIFRDRSPIRKGLVALPWEKYGCSRALPVTGVPGCGSRWGQVRPWSSKETWTNKC